MTLILAMLLDAAVGEPRWLWSRIAHPAVAMGRIIGWMDRRFNSGARRRMKGALCLSLLVVAAGALGVILAALPGPFVDILVVAVLLAQRSLAQHVLAVADALRMSLAQGRRAVGMIVGRDTAQMTAPDVARSAIESAAENLSDGVIAPAFWYLIAGLPGILIYKIVNTADSMIGYRTPRHESFGWAAARLDDLMNIIPARLTALMIWLSAPRPEKISDIVGDAPLHRSPNAGWPEAAMAYGLNVALSGPRSYDGARRDYPFVNAAGRRDIGPHEIAQAVRRLWMTWAIFLIIPAVTVVF